MHSFGCNHRISTKGSKFILHAYRLMHLLLINCIISITNHPNNYIFQKKQKQVIDKARILFRIIRVKWDILNQKNTKFIFLNNLNFEELLVDFIKKHLCTDFLVVVLRLIR